MAFAQGLAQHLLASDNFHTLYIELKGPLGSGKTTLVRHLLRALGVEGRIKSPTYAVLETYNPKGFPIFHFDFYRLQDAKELEHIGIRDYFTSTAICLIEWPEKGLPLLPKPDLACYFSFLDGDGDREIGLEAHSAAGEAVLHSL